MSGRSDWDPPEWGETDPPEDKSTPTRRRVPVQPSRPPVTASRVIRRLCLILGAFIISTPLIVIALLMCVSVVLAPIGLTLFLLVGCLMSKAIGQPSASKVETPEWRR